MILTRIRNRTLPATLGLTSALVLAATLAGCGGDDDDQPGGASSNTVSMDHGAEGMGGIGDPNLTPAKDVADAEHADGAFQLLDTRPPGTDEVKGHAWLATSADHGTTLTVELTGLRPGAHFMSHLHAKPCAEENGGPHFRFDPKGPETPPNEIHLSFVADDQGRGFMSVHNADDASAAASVVVHPAEAQDNRLACADF